MGDFLQQLMGSINPYYLQILVNIGIGIILALGLNVVTGLTGQLSLGHAAFMSIGAFTSALFTIKLGMPFGVNLILTGFITAAVAALIGLPILRLTGDYLAICTRREHRCADAGCGMGCCAADDHRRHLHSRLPLRQGAHGCQG